MVLPLGLSIVQNLTVILFIAVCTAIILIVLLQKGRGGGIGAAFGGGGAGSLLGTKTGDFLTWVTICLVLLFLVMAVLMGKFMRPPELSDQVTTTMSAPEETPIPGETDTDTALPPDLTDGVDDVEDAAADVIDEAAGIVDEAADAATEIPDDAAEVVEETAEETN